MRCYIPLINNVQFFQRELQLLSQILNPTFQCARLEGGELIEQWQNRNRVDGDRKQLKEDSKNPEIVEEAVPSFLHDFQDSTDDGNAKYNPQHLTLDHVRNP